MILETCSEVPRSVLKGMDTNLLILQFPARMSGFLQKLPERREKERERERDTHTHRGREREREREIDLPGKRASEREREKREREIERDTTYIDG